MFNLELVGQLGVKNELEPSTPTKQDSFSKFIQSIPVTFTYQSPSPQVYVIEK